MAKQPLGITLSVPDGQEATGVYESADGVVVFTTDTPYILSDGKSLSPPLPVFDAGGPVFTDSMGNSQTALAVSGMDTPPVNTALPAISGAAMVGQTLTGTNGTWTGTPTPTLVRQWMADGVAIPGATGATYTPVVGDIGKTITLRVTGTNSAGNAVATSAPTAAVLAALAAPVNTAVPTVSGTAQVGEILTATVGSWTGNPTPTYEYLWQSSSTGTGAWAGIFPPQTAATYTPIESDAGEFLRVQVTATNSQGDAVAVSAATAAVEDVPVDFNWQPVSLTAGGEGQWVGYSDGGESRPQPAFGSIDAQPTAVTQLLALYDDTLTDVYLAVFAGDFIAEMAGLTLSIGGFPLAPFDSELISGNTWLRYTGTGDLLTGSVYQIEFN